jgi:elongation factor P
MSVLSYNEVKERVYIVLDGQPFEVLSSHVFGKQMRKPVNQTKLRNLMTGKVTERSFHQNETIQEADIAFKNVTFLYHNRGEYWFCEEGNPKNRFKIDDSLIGDKGKYLKDQMAVESMVFNDTIIGIHLPVKMDFKVTEAPPSVRGNTAQGGSKQVTLEGGAVLSVPLFINEGDIVKVNTETGEYVERAEKA